MDIKKVYIFHAQHLQIHVLTLYQSIPSFNKYEEETFLKTFSGKKKMWRITRKGTLQKLRKVSTLAGYGQNFSLFADFLYIKPSPHNTAFWCAVKNILRKGDIACNKQFLFFSRCFLPYTILIFYFKYTLKCCLHFVSIWTRLKFCCLVMWYFCLNSVTLKLLNRIDLCFLRSRFYCFYPRVCIRSLFVWWATNAFFPLTTIVSILSKTKIDMSHALYKGSLMHPQTMSTYMSLRSLTLVETFCFR